MSRGRGHRRIFLHDVRYARFKPHDGSHLHYRIQREVDRGLFPNLHMLVWRWKLVEGEATKWDPVARIHELNYLGAAKSQAHKEANPGDPSVIPTVEVILPTGLAYYINGEVWSRVDYKDVCGEHEMPNRAGKYPIARWRRGELVEWLVKKPMFGSIRLVAVDAEKVLKSFFVGGI